jgi:hypothetical protein
VRSAAPLAFGVLAVAPGACGGGDDDKTGDGGPGISQGDAE